MEEGRLQKSVDREEMQRIAKMDVRSWKLGELLIGCGVVLLCGAAAYFWRWRTAMLLMSASVIAGTVGCGTKAARACY